VTWNIKHSNRLLGTFIVPFWNLPTCDQYNRLFSVFYMKIKKKTTWRFFILLYRKKYPCRHDRFFILDEVVE